MTDFSGVKQPDFDTMAGKHTQAAGRLAELAQSLHRELQGAGLDTSLAARLRELAGRITTQAEDLRRRQQLVHELQRQRVSIRDEHSGGEFPGDTGWPERRQRAARRDAGRTRRTERLARGRQGAGRAGEVRVSNRGHGVRQGIPWHPGSRRSDAATRLDRRTVAHRLGPRRSGARILALSPGPESTGHAQQNAGQGNRSEEPRVPGCGFHQRLGEAGPDRAQVRRYEVLGLPGSGTHLACSRGGAAVLEGVHGDRRTRRHRLRAASSARTNGRRARTGWAERRQPKTHRRPGRRARPRHPAETGDTGRRSGGEGLSSMVDDLFHAAKFSREASHALLDHTPAGWKESVLDYLLTSRWGASHYLGDYAPSTTY